ncbi:MAG: ABC transporter permease [Bacteroidaceae bacterium]
MKIGLDIWQEIWSTICRNKMRTFLTGFSVSWGIFMLIILLGSGNGLMNGFKNNFADRALNSMRVSTWQTSMAYGGMQSGRNIYLDQNDLALTNKEFSKYIVNSGATLKQDGCTFSYGGEYVQSRILGVYPSCAEIESYKIASGSGRFINDLDMKEARKVIVIHPTTAQTLFKGKNAIGKFINVNGVAYKVVGIYVKDNNRDDQTAFIPFSTAQLIYNKGNRVRYILFTTKNLNTIEENKAFEADYRKMIAAHHQFNPEDNNAMWIWNRFTDYLETMQAQGILNIAIWVIGIFTLLSGIVGVSNIMLITVKERTKEFGIRKALGASPASILWLIILESITITTIFGYIGMIAGIGVTEWASAIFDAQAAVQATDEMSFTIFKDPTVNIGIAIQATVLLIIAGTLAGFFPARKAVRIKPIEALRG